MADFVADDIGVRELAGRAQLLGHDVKKRKVQVDDVVARAIERPRGRFPCRTRSDSYRGTGAVSAPGMRRLAPGRRRSRPARCCAGSAIRISPRVPPGCLTRLARGRLDTAAVPPLNRPRICSGLTPNTQPPMSATTIVPRLMP